MHVAQQNHLQVRQQNERANKGHRAPLICKYYYRNTIRPSNTPVIHAHPVSRKRERKCSKNRIFTKAQVKLHKFEK